MQTQLTRLAGVRRLNVLSLCLDARSLFLGAGSGTCRPAGRRKLAARVELLELRRLLSAYLVDITADENDGDYAAGDLSLREAIVLANGAGGADTISFDAAGVFATPQTITLTGGVLNITDSVTITGSGASKLAIDDNNAPGSAMFVISDSGPGAIAVEISALTITGAQGGQGGAIFNQETLNVHDVVISGNTVGFNGQGAGIYNTGTLTLRNSTVSGNSATTSFGYGGGIYNESGTGLPGLATIIDSTISGNSAVTDAGGIYTGGTLFLVNSTVSGNSAGRLGGAIAVASGGNVTVANSTLTGNTASGGEGGAAIHNANTATFYNSTISDNTGNSSAFNYFGTTLNLYNTILTNTLPGAFTAYDIWNFGTVNGSDNIVEVFENGSVDNTTNTITSDPNLAALGPNGGPTQTMALNSPSPAIDAGNSANLPADTHDLDNDANTSEALPVDQRGLPYIRAYNAVDIGAYEVQNIDPDGVPDSVEDAGPNGGDGNYDGVPDSEQSNVASLPNSANGQYVTLESPAGSNLADVSAIANPSPSNAPNGVKFPIGFLEFTVEAVAPGSATTVTLYLPDDTKVSSYYKYGPTPGNTSPHWYNFSYDGTTGAQISAGVDPDTAPEQIVLHFVDGQRGDHDLAANGQVVDPGAPGDQTAPVAGISGPADGALNQNLTFTLSATDDSPEDQAAGFIYAIDWDGNGSTDQTTTGLSGIQVSHAYNLVGVYTVSMTATDQNGDVSAPVTSTLTVNGAQLVTDPLDATKSALLVGGTSGNDTIQFKPVRGSSKVQVLINNVSNGSFSPTGSLIALGQAGNDAISVDANFSLRALLYGNGGNDTLRSGNGPSVLLGGAGDDSLVGGNQREIQIGGDGADRLQGGNGEDILIAGSSSYDAATSDNEQALGQLLAEWARTDLDYDARANHLSRTTPGGLNGSALLTTSGTPTVFSDTAIDQLTGAQGRDWYFADLAGGTTDQLSGRTAAERLTEL